MNVQGYSPPPERNGVIGIFPPGPRAEHYCNHPGFRTYFMREYVVWRCECGKAYQLLKDDYAAKYWDRTPQYDSIEYKYETGRIHPPPGPSGASDAGSKK